MIKYKAEKKQKSNEKEAIIKAKSILEAALIFKSNFSKNHISDYAELPITAENFNNYKNENTSDFFNAQYFPDDF